MIGIIDASGAVEILLQREKADKFSKVLEESSFVWAPDLYVSELTNTLWKYHIQKYYTVMECFRYIQLGIGYVDEFIDSRELWQEAFSEGAKNKHSVYDMFYMVTARRNGGTLITNDSALARVCKKNRIQVCY